MKNWLLSAVLILATPLVLAQVTLKEGSPEEYYVKSGDTLWDISSTFLDDPWLWPEVWHLNPQVKNPHLIYPGDKLSLVTINGETKITVTERKKAVKLSPGTTKLQPTIRTEKAQQAIPTIPLDEIDAFLTKNRIVDLEAFENAPYVIAGADGRIITTKGDKIYARGDAGVNNNYGIYRKGRVFVDPETKEPLGIQAISVAEAKVVAQDDDVATIVLNKMSQEVRIGDYLLPEDVRAVQAELTPKAPSKDIKAQILMVENGVTQVGVLDVVAINVGSAGGIAEGDILAVSRQGNVVRDDKRKELIRLPDVQSGLMIIFRTFDKMAYGLILQADRALHIGDAVSNP